MMIVSLEAERPVMRYVFWMVVTIVGLAPFVWLFVAIGCAERGYC